MELVLFDPGHFTPDYLAGLRGGLEAAGQSARVITSPPAFESGPALTPEDAHWLFSPWLARRRTWLRNRRFLRRLLRLLGYPAGLWRTWRLLRPRPAGVFHVHWALLPWLDAWLLGRLRRHGWRIVLTVHDQPPSRGFRRWSHRRLYARVDAAIVHTLGLRQALLTAYPELAGRVHVIAHGATPMPPVSDHAVRTARRRLGLPEEVPLLVSCGMLKPYKGLEDLIEAFALVRREFPSARLVIAGEPLMPLRALESAITRLRLEDAIVFRPGFIPADQLPLYFIASDLIVAPYRQIAASGIVTQAQSYGKAVVVTRVGGLAESVEADRSGVVVAPGDPKALAAALGAALADPDAIRAMGERGRSRIVREQDWNQVARETLELYRQGAGDTSDLHLSPQLDHPVGGKVKERGR